MEEKIKRCVEAGAKNKISYEIRAGHAADRVGCRLCSDKRVTITDTQVNAGKKVCEPQRKKRNLKGALSY
jgi:hypothetical protein